jgi:hypothetical protein
MQGFFIWNDNSVRRHCCLCTVASLAYEMNNVRVSTMENESAEEWSEFVAKKGG